MPSEIECFIRLFNLSWISDDPILIRDGRTIASSNQTIFNHGIIRIGNSVFGNNIVVGIVCIRMDGSVDCGRFQAGKSVIDIFFTIQNDVIGTFSLNGENVSDRIIFIYQFLPIVQLFGGDFRCRIGTVVFVSDLFG